MNYHDVTSTILKKQYSWLITGAAGFIGSNLVEELLNYNQIVFAVDNFITGKKENIECLESTNPLIFKNNFQFFELDLTDPSSISNLPRTDFILHQAALGSVPRSIKNPTDTHNNNVTGFFNILEHARRIEVKSFTYASSSSVYGDNEQLPKVEGNEGYLLSPYAATKKINETYAQAFSNAYFIPTTGLRYFNVFGPRQDPMGEYAAVIPRWIEAVLRNQPIQIFGDGETSRDFCYVSNAVQANILSAFNQSNKNLSRVFNVACGQKTSLNELAKIIVNSIAKYRPNVSLEIEYDDFRHGDIKHSLADISSTTKELGYTPDKYIQDGMDAMIQNILGLS